MLRRASPVHHTYAFEAVLERVAPRLWRQDRSSWRRESAIHLMSTMQDRPPGPRQIAIDGPVASGKSTVAKKLSERLGCAFLDTGALYRAVAYVTLDRGLRPDDEAAVAALVRTHGPTVIADHEARGYRIAMAGRTLSDELFQPAVSRAVSPIAAMPEVRKQLVEAQRRFADARDVVMAGRDIGSLILPNAAFKFFLTASLDARVDRRFHELQAAGVSIDRSALYEEIRGRDERDTSRHVSPLVKAPDAIEIDSSHMSAAEVVQRLLQVVTP